MFAEIIPVSWAVLNRNFTELEVRRAFTSFQLMTVLEENHHSFLIVEHEPDALRGRQRDVEVRGPGPEADL